jgi:phosphatidylserine/phosphatidylglycerophosphate/cardiolipin synthase-like enzyme
VDGAAATVWFSPNTPHARRSHPGPDEPVPPDLDQVFGLMAQAKRSILFLEFEPGSPSVIDKAAEIAKANPELVVRGAVTDPKAAGSFDTTLVRSAQQDAEVVPASAIVDQFGFWQHELLKAGPSAHAIIHDKIVVIDPFSPDCVVVTGSHNQGYRASYNNDENLLVVRGHQPLAVRSRAVPTTQSRVLCPGLI